MCLQYFWAVYIFILISGMATMIFYLFFITKVKLHILDLTEQEEEGARSTTLSL